MLELTQQGQWLRIKGSNFGGIFRDFPKSLMRLIIGTEDMYCMYILYIYIDFENGRWGISILLRLFTSAIKIIITSLPAFLRATLPSRIHSSPTNKCYIDVSMSLGFGGKRIDWVQKGLQDVPSRLFSKAC